MKLYADEDGDLAIRELDSLVISAVARVEVPSALWRKARTDELDDASACLLVNAFELDFHGDADTGSDSRFTVVSLTESVLVAAAQEAARHGLRAYDAVQLACAVAVRELDAQCSQFACFDDELRLAASRVGFALVPAPD